MAQRHLKVTIYPRLMQSTNPYIEDFVTALQENGVEISNPKHKNPLFSLLPHRINSDAYIFNWIENVPDYKHGFIQTLVAVYLIIIIKVCRKKVVWFLHNKQPHIMKHRTAKLLLMQLMAHSANIIVTHAKEGLEVADEIYKGTSRKCRFMHHPTKNRISNESAEKMEYDILIWGGISRYKGVKEFVDFCTTNDVRLKVKIIGRCATDELYREIKSNCTGNITIENRSISFAELAVESRKARFILIPYRAESVLSSGVLMDSLSVMAKVIGPDTGSFKDYSRETLINVYTYNTYAEIPTIVANNDVEADEESYKQFLTTHCWDNFAKEFINLID
jgi:hypothetical protein